MRIPNWVLPALSTSPRHSLLTTLHGAPQQHGMLQAVLDVVVELVVDVVVVVVPFVVVVVSPPEPPVPVAVEDPQPAVIIALSQVAANIECRASMGGMRHSPVRAWERVAVSMPEKGRFGWEKGEAARRGIARA